jgi:hypothetical protein
VRVQVLAIVTVGVLAAVELPPPPAAVRRITWEDTAPVRSRLQAAGLTASTFDSRIEALSREARSRVREGDMEHLIHYVLQSTHFTRLPPIEPALSARAFVEGMKGSTTSQPGRFPPAVDARVTAFLKAVDSSDRDPRLAYFRALLGQTAYGLDRRAILSAEYLRVMVFLHGKEFLTRGRPEATAALYRTRGLSTDTAVESGYAVQVGLGVLKALESSRRIRRVLIVGPGIDLAPRTGLLEAGPPESYQPWAVIDALVSLGLATLDDLEVVGADINQRVVDHLRVARTAPPVLRLITGLGENAAVAFSQDYRGYFVGLGRSIGTIAQGRKAPAGHLAKTVSVGKKAAALLRAEQMNIVTERLDGEQFDLVIATNILPYFGATELLLALSNISAMLSPGGVLLHNELRPSLPEDAAAAGLPAEQSRQVVVATVTGAPPLVDTIWLHRKAAK